MESDASIQRLGRAWRRWWAQLRAPWRRAARSFRRTRRRNLLTLAGVLALLAVSGALFEAAGLRIQHTASLPKGIYRVVRSAEPVELLRPGVIGLWCLPLSTARWAAVRGYLRPGRCASGVEPLAKVVLAISGDTVDFDEWGVSVGGRRVANSQPLSRDGLGRSLPPAPYGRYVLRSGDAWVWSPFTRRSFDSRYLGPLPVAALQGIVRPVWTLPLPISVEESGL
jgi:conjugative transfer signal peptidase TraF